MVHVLVNGLSRPFHPALYLFPLFFIDHVMKLCFQSRGISAVQASELTETTVAIFGSPLQNPKTPGTATVVTSPVSTFTNQGLKSGLLADVAHDCCKGIFVFNAFVLQEVKGSLFVV